MWIIINMYQKQMSIVGLFVNTIPGLLECSYVEMKATGCHDTLFVSIGWDLQGRFPGRARSEREAEPEEGRAAGPAESGLDWYRSTQTGSHITVKSACVFFCFPKQIQYEPKFTITKLNCVSLWARQCKSSGVFFPNPFSCVSGDFYYLFLGVL